MPYRSGDTAPYAPPTNITDFIKRYRDRGLPTPITTEVLERAGVSPTLSQRTLQSLKLLAFLDADGNPTELFDAACRAPEAMYRQQLGELITDVYSEVIRFADPATDSYDSVRDAFRGFNPRGQQDRMVTLFLGLLEFVGMDISAATASRAKRPADGANGGRRTKVESSQRVRQGTTKGTGGATGGKARTPTPSSENADLESQLPDALVGLLRHIPRSGSWTTTERDNFLKTFETVLNYSILTVADDFWVPVPDDDQKDDS